MIRLEVALARASERLATAGIEAPRREARLLASHLLGLSGAQLPDPQVMIDEQQLCALAERRAAREPLAFITGRQGFWTIDVGVSPATLIPRADSESLIEAAVAHFSARGQVRRILDIGTGTGCLLLAALVEFPLAWGLGIDVAPAAAALASRNASANGLDGRASFASGNWTEALGRTTLFDLILCNPPYIPSGAIATLMPEVSMHEPRRALDGGADGLSGYRAIMPALASLLQPRGAAIFELGHGQRVSVSALAARAGLVDSACRHDLAGHPRALVLTRGA